MAKITPAGLADLYPFGSPPRSSQDIQTEPNYLQGHPPTDATRSVDAEIRSTQPKPSKAPCGAIDSLYCKEVQSPPRGPNKLAKHSEREKEKVSVSHPTKAARAGAEAPGEGRPQTRDGRRGKTNPPSKIEHLPPFQKFRRLSLTDDCLDGIAYLPTAPTANPSRSLLAAPAGQTLLFDSYTLRPQEYGRGNYSRVYDVLHSSHLDKIATLSTHPVRGRRSMCSFHVENHLHYNDQAVKLLIGLLDAVGATNVTLTRWEIQITGPRILEIPEYILANELKRKGKRTWHINSGEGGKVIGMHVGKQASPRCFRLYRNGLTLQRRNRQYIARRTVADGVARQEVEKSLARLEVRINGKEFKRLTYVDAFGEVHPVTLQSLLNPLVRLAVFRQQVESAFVFRKRIGKDRYATAQFFDWEAIERHYASLYGLSESNRTVAVRKPIKARSSSATHSAKQTVKLLAKDGQPSSYLVKCVQKLIEQTAVDPSIKDLPRQQLIHKLSNAGCALPTSEIDEATTACFAEAIERLASKVSTALPVALAQSIASEHGIVNYHKKLPRVTPQV